MLEKDRLEEEKSGSKGVTVLMIQVIKPEKEEMKPALLKSSI